MYYFPYAGSVSSDHSPGVGPILLSNVSCSGTEDSLWNCSSLGVGVHNCIDHSLDAGVTCQGEICLLLST